MAKTTLRIVDGYLLEVPPYWDELTAADLERICNGVGPDEWPAWRRRLLGDLAPWMVPASKPHDVRYAKPQTPAERKEADKELRRNWISTIRQRLGWRWWHWFVPGRRTVYAAQVAMARLAYRAVRIAGAEFSDATQGGA